MILICETCTAELAKIDEENLCQPITGAMLLPITPQHMDIFDDSLEWLYIKCPMCGYRPFELPDKIKTDKGYIDVPKSIAILEPKRKKKNRNQNASKK